MDGEPLIARCYNDRASGILYLAEWHTPSVRDERPLA
jgi:hypothetical protein